MTRKVGSYALAFAAAHRREIADRKKKGIPFALGRAGHAPCAHCHRPVRQMYMLYDDVWLQAIRDARGLAGAQYLGINLHIGCAEKRLGRRLTARDFYYKDSGDGPNRQRRIKRYLQRQAQQKEKRQ